MTPDSRRLYESIILDHNKSPRNYGKPAQAAAAIEAVNPLCGDTFTLYLVADGEHITTLSFEGNGCAISKASASLMTCMLKGKTREAAVALGNAFESMLQKEPDAPVNEALLGDLMAFSGVRAFPMRIKCAVLCWRALLAHLTA